MLLLKSVKKNVFKYINFKKIFNERIQKGKKNINIKFCISEFFLLVHVLKLIENE